MLKTALTRVVQHFAQQYVKDIRTDSFSLWGGELILQNLELRLDKVEQALGLGPNLRLKRGFIRELRVTVPWSSLKTRSVTVSADAIEVVFTEKFGDDPPPMVTRQASGVPDPVAEGSESWLRPLIRSVVHNMQLVVTNLVVKFVWNTVSVAVSCGRFDTFSCSTPPEWKVGFQDLDATGVAVVHRVASITDIVVSVDRVPPCYAHLLPNRSFVKSAPEPALLHRASLKVYLVLPLLPSHQLLLDLQLKECNFRCTTSQLSLIRRWLSSKSEHSDHLFLHKVESCSRVEKEGREREVRTLDDYVPLTVPRPVVLNPGISPSPKAVAVEVAAPSPLKKSWVGWLGGLLNPFDLDFDDETPDTVPLVPPEEREDPLVGAAPPPATLPKSEEVSSPASSHRAPSVQSTASTPLAPTTPSAGSRITIWLPRLTLTLHDGRKTEAPPVTRGTSTTHSNHGLLGSVELQGLTYLTHHSPSSSTLSVLEVSSFSVADSLGHCVVTSGSDRLSARVCLHDKFSLHHSVPTHPGIEPCPLAAVRWSSVTRPLSRTRSGTTSRFLVSAIRGVVPRGSWFPVHQALLAQARVDSALAEIEAFDRSKLLLDLKEKENNVIIRPVKAEGEPVIPTRRTNSTVVKFDGCALDLEVLKGSGRRARVQWLGVICPRVEWGALAYVTEDAEAFELATFNLVLGSGIGQLFLKECDIPVRQAGSFLRITEMRGDHPLDLAVTLRDPGRHYMNDVIRFSAAVGNYQRGIGELHIRTFSLTICPKVLSVVEWALRGSGYASTLGVSEGRLTLKASNLSFTYEDGKDITSS